MMSLCLCMRPSFDEEVSSWIVSVWNAHPGQPHKKLESVLFGIHPE